MSLPPEIAEMEGLDKKSSSVRQLIVQVSDQLRAGEINLLGISPEESVAAKLRLDDAKNKKNRGRIKIK